MQWQCALELFDVICQFDVAVLAVCVERQVRDFGRRQRRQRRTTKTEEEGIVTNTSISSLIDSVSSYLEQETLVDFFKPPKVDENTLINKNGERLSTFLKWKDCRACIWGKRLLNIPVIVQLLALIADNFVPLSLLARLAVRHAAAYRNVRASGWLRGVSLHGSSANRHAHD